jgi:hypothetical protein
MNFHKIFSPFRCGIVRVKKHIDDIYAILLAIGLNGFVKNSYMNIGIYSHDVDGVG